MGCLVVVDLLSMHFPLDLLADCLTFGEELENEHRERQHQRGHMSGETTNI